jgi:DNA replication protein DnaC
MTATHDTGASLDGPLTRLLNTIRKNTNDLNAFMANQPLTIRCGVHPDQDRHLNADKSRLNDASYDPCPKCAEERDRIARHKKQGLMGIPPKFFDARLDQLSYTSKHDQANLKKCCEYAALPSGVLVLRGGVGNGKTHAAAAILIQHGRGRFFSHADLLKAKRRAYEDHDDTACADAIRSPLLVIDELGVGASGSDAYDLLHDAIDSRDLALRPTIITSNLPDDEFKALLGERLYNRLEGAERFHLRFVSPSARKACRDAYIIRATNAQTERLSKLHSKVNTTKN